MTLSRQRLSQLRNPERNRARLAVRYALKTGKLVRALVCSNCATAAKVQAHHHHGYAEESKLDVVWLCSTCHGLASRASEKPKPEYASEISAIAAALGKLGGKVKSEAKAEASRKNGTLGGRPKKKP